MEKKINLDKFFFLILVGGCYGNFARCSNRCMLNAPLRHIAKLRNLWLLGKLLCISLIHSLFGGYRINTSDAITDWNTTDSKAVLIFNSIFLWMMAMEDCPSLGFTATMNEILIYYGSMTFNDKAGAHFSLRGYQSPYQMRYDSTGPRRLHFTAINLLD